MNYIFRNRRRRIGLVAVILLVVMFTVSCSRFDASGYTQAILDANFKNETTEYVKMTEESEKVADALFSDNVDGILASLLVDTSVSESITQKGEAIFGNILKAADYKVLKAKRTDSGYVVDVEFKQMKIFDGVTSEYKKQVDAYTQSLSESASGGAEVPSDQEMNDHIASILLDILQAELDAGIQYGETQTLTMHVLKEKGNLYTMNMTDYEKILSCAVDLDKVQ